MAQLPLRDRITRLTEALWREHARYENLQRSMPENALADANLYALSLVLDGLASALHAPNEKHLRDSVQFLAKQVLGKTASDFVQTEEPTTVPQSHHEAMAFRRLHAQLVNLLRDLPEDEDDE